MVSILQGDALEHLREIESMSVDALITDPPYCSGAATEAGRGFATHQGLRSESINSGRFQWFSADNMTTSGLVWLLRGLAVQAARVLLPTGHLCVFCDWRMAFQIGPAMESAGLRLRNLIVWDKGHFGCGTGFRPQHELILHLTKRAPEFHSAYFGNVLRCPRVPSDDRIHPTEKPQQLLEALITVTTPEGGLVVDPFMGSGATIKAARKLGRRAIGIDVDPNYTESWDDAPISHGDTQLSMLNGMTRP